MSSALVNSCCFLPRPGTHGCSIARIDWRYGLRAMASSNRVHIEKTDTSFIIGWTGSYRINGPAFVYSDRQRGRAVTILGYPTDQITGAL